MTTAARSGRRRSPPDPEIHEECVAIRSRACLNACLIALGRNAEFSPEEIAGQLPPDRRNWLPGRMRSIERPRSSPLCRWLAPAVKCSVPTPPERPPSDQCSTSPTLSRHGSSGSGQASPERPDRFDKNFKTHQQLYRLGARVVRPGVISPGRGTRNAAVFQSLSNRVSTP